MFDQRQPYIHNHMMTSIYIIVCIYVYISLYSKWWCLYICMYVRVYVYMWCIAPWVVLAYCFPHDREDDGPQLWWWFEEDKPRRKSTTGQYRWVRLPPLLLLLALPHVCMYVLCMYLWTICIYVLCLYVHQEGFLPTEMIAMTSSPCASSLCFFPPLLFSSEYHY